MTDTPFTSAPESQHVTGDEREARPDLKAPPPSPEPDQEAMDKGIETLESVKPY